LDGCPLAVFLHPSQLLVHGCNRLIDDSVAEGVGDRIWDAEAIAHVPGFELGLLLLPVAFKSRSFMCWPQLEDRWVSQDVLWGLACAFASAPDYNEGLLFLLGVVA
jgi:hypothetical protein